MYIDFLDSDQLENWVAEHVNLQKKHWEHFYNANDLIDYVADWFSSIGEALEDNEYEELVDLIYSIKQPEKINDYAYADFKDYFTIKLLWTGDWILERDK